ncbi:MAG TPA: hypothetical protein VF595_06460 [Tepidisphaeraceae bacterium]|jgi:hypothetical protein
MNVFRSVVVGLAGVSLGLLVGCEDKAEKAPPAETAGAHDGHDHAPPTTAPVAGHGGPIVALGSATAGAFQLSATRDQGPIEAGKDTPIDVTVTPAAGAAKPTAVRFWIGTEDAKGSAKAKAEVENPAEPNRWHTHVDIPTPLPADAKLWVEVEAEGGAKSTASFDLKR